MAGELKVVTAHVRELAVKQGEIVAEVAPARAATGGVTWDVAISHGLICAPASVALAGANTARGLACAAIQKTSQELQDALSAAALHYDVADAQASGSLDQTMHPR